MRNMARIQAFLEGMDDYRKVVEAFLNCTPFLGYVWVGSLLLEEIQGLSNYSARVQLDLSSWYISLGTSCQSVQR